MSIPQSLELLRKYDHLGYRRFDDGTQQIGKAPHIAPLAWLHTIYQPLSEKELVGLEEALRRQIPASYRAFLQVTNGLTVFTRELTFYGLRTDYSRDPYAILQPFDIITPNTLERPANAKDTTFIIGGYSWDGSSLYIDTTTDQVFLCRENNIKPLQVWEHFDDMLEKEINRLSTLFDDQGRQLKPNTSTLPVGKQSRWWTSLLGK